MQDFYHVEEGKDVGNSVREKARSLNALLRDEERLQEERTKALLARERLMHGGALGNPMGGASSTYSPPAHGSSFGRPNSSTGGLGGSFGGSGDTRRPSSQPSFSGGEFISP